MLAVAQPKIFFQKEKFIKLKKIHNKQKNLIFKSSKLVKNFQNFWFNFIREQFAF